MKIMSWRNGGDSVNSESAVCVHVCIEKSSSGEIISSLVRFQKLKWIQVKYYIPLDTKTISLQNNREFISRINF